MKVQIRTIKKDGESFRASVEFPNGDVLPVTANTVEAFNRQLRATRRRITQRDEEMALLEVGEYIVPEETNEEIEQQEKEASN